jgi:hypothetical protein
MSPKDMKKEPDAKVEVDQMDNLVEYLSSEIGMKIEDPQSKSKTSFYITRLTQIQLKKLSDTYGIAQGDIINRTPLLFAKLMQLSLERRKRSIATLRTLNQQIQSSIEAMKSIAPHLSGLLGYPADMVYQLIDLEEKAVEHKTISGLGVKKDTVDDLDFPLSMLFIAEPFESEPAYQRDLDELMGDTKIGDLFLSIITDKLAKKGDRK